MFFKTAGTHCRHFGRSRLCDAGLVKSRGFLNLILFHPLSTQHFKDLRQAFHVYMYLEWSLKSQNITSRPLYRKTAIIVPFWCIMGKNVEIKSFLRPISFASASRENEIEFWLKEVIFSRGRASSFGGANRIFSKSRVTFGGTRQNRHSVSQSFYKCTLFIHQINHKCAQIERIW